MGLSSKEPVIVVKEEVNNDVCKEIGIACSSLLFFFTPFFSLYNCSLFLCLCLCLLFFYSLYGREDMV